MTSLRAAPETEGLGMDVTQHGEEAYTNGEGSILVIPEPARPRSPPRLTRIPRRADAGGRPMKLIVAIIRPERLNEVLEALYRAEVRG